MICVVWLGRRDVVWIQSRGSVAGWKRCGLKSFFRPLIFILLLLALRVSLCGGSGTRGYRGSPSIASVSLRLELITTGPSYVGTTGAGTTGVGTTGADTTGAAPPLQASSQRAALGLPFLATHVGKCDCT